MRILTKSLLLLSAFALVSVGWAGNLEEATETGILERTANPMGVVKFAQKNPVRIIGPGPLPVPIEPESAGTFSASVKGPVAFSATALGESYGGALIRPRGGSFSSPRQQADREIRSLIRRLD